MTYREIEQVAGGILGAIFKEMGDKIAHRPPSAIIGLGFHCCIEEECTGLVLPRTTETIVALALDNTIGEYITVLERRRCGGCGYISAGDFMNNSTVVIEVVTASAYVVDRTVDSTVEIITALTCDLGVLDTLECDVFMMSRLPP